MKKVRLRELENWPPEPGGAHDPDARFPAGGEGRVDEIFPVQENGVPMRGDFNGRSHSSDYHAPSEIVAVLVHKIVAQNLGNTVRELGELEIEIE
jgi:hypothetical protein